MQLRIQCEPGGMLVIIGEPEQPNNPWGVTPFRKVAFETISDVVYKSA